MRNFIVRGAAAAFLAITAASPAHASLVGDTLGCTSTPPGFFDCSVSSFTVGAGSELTMRLVGSSFFEVDFSATTIQFSFLAPFGAPFGLGAGETVTFTGFDDVITSVDIAALNISGLTLADLSFTDSSLSINVDSGANYGAGASFTVTVNSGQTVPAPATLPLVGLALGALALARRRKA